MAHWVGVVGLTPPAGLALDYACRCFQTPDGAVSITITAVRAPYAQFDTGFADHWRRKGMSDPVRETLRVSGRDAFLLHGNLVEGGRTTHVAVLVADGPRAVVNVVAQVPSDRQAAFPVAAPAIPSGAQLRGEAPRAAWQPEGESAFVTGTWRWTVQEASGYNPHVPIFRKQLRLRRAVFVGVHPRGTLRVEATYLDANAKVMGTRVTRFVRGLDIP